MTIEFGIVGALGRMGRAIANRAASGNLSLVTPIEFAKHPDQGKKYSAVTGLPFDAEIVALQETHSPPGGLIDFSHATTVIETLRKAVETGAPVVVGTTGFTAEQRKELETMGSKIPLIIASNMAIGVNVLFSTGRPGGAHTRRARL